MISASFNVGMITETILLPEEAPPSLPGQLPDAITEGYQEIGEFSPQGSSDQPLGDQKSGIQVDGIYHDRLLAIVDLLQGPTPLEFPQISVHHREINSFEVLVVCAEGVGDRGQKR